MNAVILWIVPGCAVVTLIGTYIIQIRGDARRDGVVDEKLKVANARLRNVEDDVKDQGQRLANIEGQLGAVAVPAHRR